MFGLCAAAGRILYLYAEGVSGFVVFAIWALMCAGLLVRAILVTVPQPSKGAWPQALFEFHLAAAWTSCAGAFFFVISRPDHWTLHSEVVEDPATELLIGIALVPLLWSLLAAAMAYSGPLRKSRPLRLAATAPVFIAISLFAYALLRAHE